MSHVSCPGANIPKNLNVPCENSSGIIVNKLLPPLNHPGIICRLTCYHLEIWFFPTAP